MKDKVYTSVFDLKGKDLELFLEKYGDIFEPKMVDFDYYKMYYLGKFDPFIHILNYIATTYDINQVVYPGSFIHISPSFAFSHVDYIDVYDNIEDFFEDSDVHKYLDLHKIYDNPCDLTFYHQSYVEYQGSYDLMISSNAGSISMDCKDLLKDQGLLLVNNGHSDADNAFDDDDYQYLGYFKYNGNKSAVTFVLDEKAKRSDTYYLFRLVKDER